MLRLDLSKLCLLAQSKAPNSASVIAGRDLWKDKRLPSVKNTSLRKMWGTSYTTEHLASACCDMHRYRYKADFEEVYKHSTHMRSWHSSSLLPVSERLFKMFSLWTFSRSLQTSPLPPPILCAAHTKVQVGFTWHGKNAGRVIGQTLVRGDSRFVLMTMLLFATVEFTCLSQVLSNNMSHAGLIYHD